jgi:hypothetical protein
MVAENRPRLPMLEGGERSFLLIIVFITVFLLFMTKKTLALEQIKRVVMQRT